MLLIVLVAVVLAGLLAAKGFSGGAPTRPAAAAAEGGLVALQLRPGQALRTVAVNVDTIEWPGLEPAAGGGFIGSQRPTRGLVQYREHLGQWFAYDGAIRTAFHPASAPQFIGSTIAHSAWNIDFRAHRQAWLTGLGSGPFVGGQGFFFGPRRVSYRNLLNLPTDPGLLVRAIRGAAAPAGADPITVVAGLLTEPLPAAERAAVIRAAELLPGVRYLPSVHDPLGRPGAALATEGTNAPGSRHGWRIQVEYVFNPRTYALLAYGSTLVSRTDVQGVTPGFHLDWRAYISSKIVPRSDVPRLP